MGLLNSTRVSATVGGKEIILETGRVARQANGAIWIQCGGTVALVTVCEAQLDTPKDFFPLTVEYAERMYAAGRIPGNFFRREIGRPSDHETLVARLLDRPIRWTEQVVDNGQLEKFAYISLFFGRFTFQYGHGFEGDAASRLQCNLEYRPVQSHYGSFRFGRNYSEAGQ